MLKGKRFCFQNGFHTHFDYISLLLLFCTFALAFVQCGHTFNSSWSRTHVNNTCSSSNDRANLMFNVGGDISCRSVYLSFFDEDEIRIIPFSNFLPLELSTSKNGIQSTWDHSAYANTFSSAMKCLIIERAPSKVFTRIAARTEPTQQHSSISSHNGILVNIYLLYFCFVVHVCGCASILAKNRPDIWMAPVTKARDIKFVILHVSVGELAKVQVDITPLFSSLIAFVKKNLVAIM